MDALISSSVVGTIRELVFIATRDAHAELEVKVLPGQIQTKDVADRIVKAIDDMTVGGFTEEHRASFSYPDGLRVNVLGPENIHKVCTTNSFRGVPLMVERKRKYFDVGTSVEHKTQEDVVDIPDLKLRITLRHEEFLRKDFGGSPMDPSSYLRILHRKSWKTTDGLLQIDMSMVKSKKRGHKTFVDVLRQTPEFELEVEVIKRDVPEEKLLESIFRHVEQLVAAFQQSPFLLTESDLQRYRVEFEAMKIRFVNPITLERRHLRRDREHNLLTGYTVTNKADGERSFLVVGRDKRLLRFTPSGKITWTGIVALKDTHIGDVVDGEYLADRNLFCIFDVYHFRGKSTLRLPLITTDDDVTKDPLKSRLGSAHLFVDDLRKEFRANFSRVPFRIETKMFVAGDGPMMERAVQTLLDTKFEYPTDGLIFTPRASGVAPSADRKGDSWLRVYKWKPADQNSIDFLVRFAPSETYDPVLGQRVFRGTLYVSRSPGSDIVYPCETITGEYTAPTLPPDLRVIAETRDRVPTPFQPMAPNAPNASEILIPVNAKGTPVDKEGNRIEDNTIIECARDIDRGRWVILRTRYDKTYQYRVLGQPQFGNDLQKTAQPIWTNIHNPVTEEMIRHVTANPPDDTFEDDLYFRDDLEVRDRVMRDIRAFHNKVKETLYQSAIKSGDTLLELAVGRANDLHKWRKTKPSKVVGLDLSRSNLDSPKQGACVRYLQESTKTKLPPVLFAVADMTQPLMDQESRYLKILDKREPATTPYLEKFAGLTEFDAISCQFAIHYACETEDTFRTFVGNLTRHGKGVFFGTCMDGQSVYSLLLGKTGHVFRAETQIFGEFTKEYADGLGWTDEFGKAIQVKMESFEKAQREYLVPFGRITEILKENGYELVRTTMFSDEYAQQSSITITGDYQTFSFLHRSFIFKKVERKPVTEEQAVEIPVIEEEKKEEEEKKPKAKRVTIKVKELPEIVFFFSGNPALNEHNYLSSMHEAPMQIDGVTFPTVEHYYQWSKAKMFGDKDAETKILKTTSPKSVKSYGKKVKDFKEEEWTAKKDKIMETAIKAKFAQHPDLRKKLLETGTALIAKADPRDKYWGIGTSADTSKAKDPAKWPGKNVLGKMLETLRAE